MDTIAEKNVVQVGTTEVNLDALKPLTLGDRITLQEQYGVDLTSNKVTLTAKQERDFVFYCLHRSNKEVTIEAVSDLELDAALRTMQAQHAANSRGRRPL